MMDYQTALVCLSLFNGLIWFLNLFIDQSRGARIFCSLVCGVSIGTAVFYA